MKTWASGVLTVLTAALTWGQTVHVWLQGGPAQVGLGDTVEVEIWVDAGPSRLTSAAVYLSFDGRYLRPVDGNFVPGGFLDGTIYENGPDENGLDEKTADQDLRWLNYVVVAPPGAGQQRPAGSGRGVLARLRLKTVAWPPGGQVAVRLDDAGRRRVVYTEARTPGQGRRALPLERVWSATVRDEGVLPIGQQLLGVEEKRQIDLDPYVRGMEAARLRWHWAVSDSSVLQAFMAGGRLQLAAGPGEGTATVEYRAADAEGRQWNGRFVARVLPGRAAQVTLREDAGPLAVELPALSGETAAWRLAEDAGLRAVWQDGLLRLDPPADTNGQFEVLLEHRASGQVYRVPVWVEAVNDPPVIVAQEPLRLLVGQTRPAFSKERLVRDRDDALEALRLTASGDAQVDAVWQGDALHLTGLAAGSGRVQLQVSDAAGSQATGWLDVEVVAAGIAPRLIGPSVWRLLRGEAVEVMLEDLIEDGDSPPDELLWTAQAAGAVSLQLAADRLVLRGLAVGTGRIDLQVEDRQGNRAATAWAVEITAAPVPTAVAEQTVGVDLAPVAFPNPFNAAVSLRYGMASAGRVRLTLYGVDGRRVRTVDNGWRAGGQGRIVWDGRDAAGRAAASGYYLYLLEAGRRTWGGKVLLLR